jgi:hypothetical protein
LFYKEKTIRPLWHSRASENYPHHARIKTTQMTNKNGKRLCGHSKECPKKIDKRYDSEELSLFR